MDVVVVRSTRMITSAATTSARYAKTSDGSTPTAILANPKRSQHENGPTLIELRMVRHMGETNYIVSTFSQPLTPIMTYAAAGTMRCQCGNEDQDKFLTVTNLAGDVLRGFVCSVCEDAAKRRS